MKPAAVLIQLCYLYGRSADWITRNLHQSPFVVAQVLKPVRGLWGCAL